MKNNILKKLKTYKSSSTLDDKYYNLYIPCDIFLPMDLESTNTNLEPSFYFNNDRVNINGIDAIVEVTSTELKYKRLNKRNKYNSILVFYMREINPVSERIDIFYNTTGNELTMSTKGEFDVINGISEYLLENTSILLSLEILLNVNKFIEYE